jgi:hypothetical protein
MLRLARRHIAILASALVLTGFLSLAGCRWLDRQHVAGMLNIPRVPNSVSNIDCESYGFTDVLERCAFRIDPKDFDALLSGYAFVKNEALVAKTLNDAVCEPPEARKCSSYNYRAGPKVGTEFIVSHDHAVAPSEFEHGGEVAVLANWDKSLVLVDLYIE